MDLCILIYASMLKVSILLEIPIELAILRVIFIIVISIKESNIATSSYRDQWRLIEIEFSWTI